MVSLSPDNIGGTESSLIRFPRVQVWSHSWTKRLLSELLILQGKLAGPLRCFLGPLSSLFRGVFGVKVSNRSKTLGKNRWLPLSFGSDLVSLTRQVWWLSLNEVGPGKANSFLSAFGFCLLPLHHPWLPSKVVCWCWQILKADAMVWNSTKSDS